MIKKHLLLLCLACLPASLFAEVKTYTVDSSHSSVNFRIRHLVTKLNGGFAKFSGKLIFDPAKLDSASAVGEVVVASVDTNDKSRDKHLQNDDFFKASKHPMMTFKSTKWEAGNTPDTYLVTGNLSFAGSTRPVTLRLVKTGETQNPMNKATVAGFEASATINRSDWGMSYGKGMVGDEVAIDIQVEAAVSVAK